MNDAEKVRETEQILAERERFLAVLAQRDQAYEALERKIREAEERAEKAEGERDKFRGALDAALSRSDELRDDKDELAERLSRWEVGKPIEPYIAEAKRLRTRIQELEAALKQIINTHGGYPDDYAAIARQALAGDEAGNIPRL